uniref:Dolichyl-diphosphooligosaccharide--protein glycosyltransferase subunit 2 n=1 Tax=Romanomermis culicivorax TaxID=13658 RepID=A0A915JYJ6_ROMCU
MIHDAGLIKPHKINLPKGHDTISSVIADAKSPASDLYKAVFSARKLQIKIDNAKLSAALQSAMKKDDSALNLSYIFHAAALLEEVPVDIFVSKTEDCVAQADEIDNKFLQFEGGISATAFTVSGIYLLAQRAKKSPTIKSEEVIKLSNFLVARKGVKLARPAYYVLQALQILTTNPYHVPVVVSKVGSSDVSSKQPSIKIRFTDLLGKSLDQSLTVVCNVAEKVSTKTSLFTKKQLKHDASNKLYELNIIESKPSVGFYNLKLSATSTDKRFVGNDQIDMTIKATTEITVENTQLALIDREQSATASNTIKVPSFSKLSTRLDADQHQKMIISFVVKDKSTNAAMKVHQTFIIFTHVESSREIIFIAECDANKMYTFDVDFSKSAKDFDYQSGKYTIRLILGDFVANNPIDWVMAEIHLKFPVQEIVEKSTVEHITFQKKPEIVHMFRPAEKRPSRIVSDSFTILVLLPLLVLFIMWLRIGINISNFQFNLCTIGFHVGLASKSFYSVFSNTPSRCSRFTGIFGLYFVFWLQLNMFQTLKYLAAIACFTFLTGNRVLKSMAERRKTKTE